MFIPVAGAAAAGELDSGCSVQAVQEAAAAERSPACSQGCLTAVNCVRLPFSFQNVHWEGRAGRERPVKRALEQRQHLPHCKVHTEPSAPRDSTGATPCLSSSGADGPLTWSATTQLQPLPSAQVRGFGKALPRHLILTVLLPATPYLGAGTHTWGRGIRRDGLQLLWLRKNH